MFPLFIHVIYSEIQNVEKDGLSYEIDGENVKITGYTKDFTNFPNSYIDESGKEYSIKIIGKGSFLKSKFAQDLVLPNTVEIIQDLAFSNSLFTGNFQLPANLHTIGDSAFSNCLNLVGFKFNEKLRIIGAGAFSYCTHVSSELFISKDIEMIKEKAFAETPFSKLTLEEGIEEIWESSFKSSLILSVLNIPSTVKYIRDQAFHNSCFKGIIFSEGLLEIGNRTFEYSFIEGLIEFPTSLTKVGIYAFSSCTRIKELKFPPIHHLTELPGDFCSGATNISEPLYLDFDVINEYAFYGCFKLPSIAFPTMKFVTICRFAFAGCFLLSGQLYVGVNGYIGESAFLGCRGIQTLMLAGYGNYSVKEKAFYGCEGIPRIEFTKIQAGQFVTFGDMAFAECISIKNDIRLPLLTEIPTALFYRCCEISGTLEIPETCKKIGAKAFFLCTGLNGILILNNVEEIGESAFFKCLNFIGGLELPETLTTIGSNAFFGCSFTGPLIIPSKVKKIPNFAFYHCTSFTGNIRLAENIEEIGASAFAECLGINGQLIIETTKLKRIGASAFYGCESLNGVLRLPDSVVEIGDFAFYRCTGLHGKLKLPENLKTIGKSSFAQCNGFHDVLVIPKSVSFIGVHAFFECRGFTEIQFETKSVEVEEKAFGNLQVNCFTNLPEQCSSKDGESSCYDSEGFGKFGYILQLNENCKVYKIVNVFLDFFMSVAFAYIAVKSATLIMKAIGELQSAKLRIKAIFEKIIVENHEEKKKDDDLKVAHEISNSINGRIKDEESVLKKHITRGMATDILRKSMEAKWAIAPLKGYNEIMDNSFNDVYFKRDLCSRFRRRCCCKCCWPHDEEQGNKNSIEMNSEEEE